MPGANIRGDSCEFVGKPSAPFGCGSAAPGNPWLNHFTSGRGTACIRPSVVDEKTNSRPNEPPPPIPAEVAKQWLDPFLDHLAKERRYSVYTVRNYRQAFED